MTQLLPHMLPLVLILAGLLLLVFVSRPAFRAAAGPGPVDPESVIPRKSAGPVTRYEVRRVRVADHWEDADEGAQVFPAPVELTRRLEPALYAEYMSDGTSAVRRYEILDTVYSMGLTLPFIPGLHERLLEEIRSCREAPAPVDMTPPSTEGVLVRPLRMDASLRDAEMPPMGPDEAPDGN